MEHLGEQPSGGEEQQDEAMRYLGILGLEEHADTLFPTRDGGTMRARDFLTHCPPIAREALAGLDAIGPEDPRYDAMVQAIRGAVFSNYLRLPSGE